MISPAIPKDDESRVAAVKEYNLLDTLPEEDFDTITTLAASICDVPISLVTLLDTDRNFLKSHLGVSFNESPRHISFCGHAILEESDIFIVEDSRVDPRFQDNPLVREHNAIFYAGVRLVSPEGYPLGTLCIFDTKPRILSASQKKSLMLLAYQVMNLFEARKQNKILQQLQEQLIEKNLDLENFAGIVSHDLKMPLANIILTADIFRQKYGDKLDLQALGYLDYLKKSSFVLSDYISGLLQHYQSDYTATLEKESFDIHHLLEEIVDLLNIKYDCDINLPEENIDLTCNRVALEQILLNLIGNSLKYNYKERVIVDVKCFEDELFYHISVKDNGMGIPSDKLEHIFELFGTTGITDRNGNKGKGIGLSTVKKLVSKLGGTIIVNSEIKKGTEFLFTIAKN